MNRRSSRWLAVSLIFLSPLLPAAEPSEEELERWFESDEPDAPYQSYRGGEQLEFIQPLREKPTPFSQTRLRLTVQSMQTGWVEVSQCHDHLDPVADAEVVYSFEQMRGLHITGQQGIAEARVSGDSVQLRDISRGASLCVALQARILRQSGSGGYRMRYGPFMRKFLDSYFPMHVALEVVYPAQRLSLVRVTPSPAGGYEHSDASGRYSIDAWFRGKLVFELYFRAREQE